VSQNRRFIPLSVTGVFAAGSYVLAVLKNDAGERMAQNCVKSTCAYAQGDFNDAVLIALFGTMLLIAGGFISVLLAVQDRWRAQSTPPPQGAPPYGPPR
jgi:hypothetical protein